MASDDFNPTGGSGTSGTSSTVAPSSGGWIAAARNPQSKELDDQTVIELRNRYQPAQSGAFPSWFPQQIRRGDAISLLERMSSIEIIQLKERLWGAGFLTGGTAGAVLAQNGAGSTEPVPNTEGPPTSPQMDAATKDAFLLFFDEAATSGGVNGGQDTLDSYMNRKISMNAAARETATAQAFNYADALEGIQTWALSKLGRYFTQEETQDLLRKTANANTSADNPYRTNYGGYGSSNSDAAVNALPLRGGGPDSTAQSYLNQLARVYGLQPLSNVGDGADFRAYRALTMTGNTEQIKALSDWVASNKADSSAVWDRNEIQAIDPNNPEAGYRLILSVKDGAEAPSIAGIDINSTQSFGDDVGKFLNAVKSSSYTWDQKQGNAFGAYGLSQQIWDYYTTNVFRNIDSSNHSQEAQDAVARAYANDLYSGQHNWQNWEDVAYAFVTNEDVARANRNGRNNLGGFRLTPTPNDSRTRVAGVLQKMANPVVTSAMPGGYVADPYTQLYGNSTGVGNAYMSDPYSIRPRTDQEFATRLLKNARDYSMDETTMNNMFNGLQSLFSKFGYDAVIQAGKG